MTTKNCANGPKLVLKDLCKKSFVRNDRLPFAALVHYSSLCDLCTIKILIFFLRNSLHSKEETTILLARDMACGPHCENKRVIKKIKNIKRVVKIKVIK